jgi:hypothetical protein
MDSSKALKILNEGKDYEEKIVTDLSEYFVSKLDSISDMTEEEKEKVHEVLDKILGESVRHSNMFTKLIEMVLSHGGDSY